MSEPEILTLVDDKSAVLAPELQSLERRFGAREYQIKAIESVEKRWLDTSITAQLISMATGTGKTILIAIFATLAKEMKKRTLVLAHTDELIDQAIDKIKKRTGTRAVKEKAGDYASRFEMVVVGSVQTMQGDLRLSSWPKNHFDQIIVDEAHHSVAAGYQKILNHFHTAKRIGVTATADRGDRKALSDIFQVIAYDYGLLQAVRDGWLVRPIVNAMPLAIDLTGVEVKQTSEGSDLDRMEVGRRLIPFMDAIARQIKEHAGSKKILVFMPSVETAQLMSAALDAAGISSDWVCGDKKLCPDRKERVARHQAGAFQALVNMAILTEGYDDDELEVIVSLRATKIRSLYAQIIGRGTRPHGECVDELNAAPNAFERLEVIKRSKKPVLLILDFLFLYEKHDLCTPASLVTKDESLERQMGRVEGDVVAAAEQAERDLLKKLESDLKKQAHKEARVVDPLAFATELSDIELENYEPKSARDAGPPSPGLLKIIKGNGLNTSKVTSFGQAKLIVDRILGRHRNGLSTVRQLHFFKKIGVDASLMSRNEASKRMEEQLIKWRARDEEKKAAKARGEVVPEPTPEEVAEAVQLGLLFGEAAPAPDTEDLSFLFEEAAT